MEELHHRPQWRGSLDQAWSKAHLVNAAGTHEESLSFSVSFLESWKSGKARKVDASSAVAILKAS